MSHSLLSPPLSLLQGIVSIVERSAVSRSGHGSTIDVGASILESRSRVDLVGNTIVRSRIQPKDFGIRQDIAAPESVDVADGVVDHIAVARHHDDGSEVLEYMGVENSHQVHSSAIEGISASANEVAVADQSLELAGFVLGKEESLHGSVLNLHAMSQSTGFVEESVDGVDVDVPLVDGCFGISCGGVVGDGVDHADIGGLATIFDGGPC